MRTSFDKRVALVCGMLAALGLAGTALSAEPPLDDFPAGAPPVRSVQQMKDRASYWAGAIRDAKDANEIISARDRMAQDYKVMEAKTAGYVFAEQAATVVAPMLRKGFDKDSLRVAKEVNLAIAISQMPQVSIQPALEEMIASGDPAVRLVGWKGYRAIRSRLLLQGLSAADRAMASAERAAKTETSPFVLEGAFRMLELEPAKPANVSQDVWDAVRKRTWNALAANWDSPWRQRVMAGEAEMAEACQQAASVAASYAATGATKQETTRLLQMLTDMAFCAAQAFIAARTDGKTGDAQAGLLHSCEAALNAITKAGKDFIGKALADSSVTTRPNIVLVWIEPSRPGTYGVYGWVDFLKNQGVVEPKAPPAPASQATTRTTAPAGIR
jgi:hypothetical protein